MKHWPIKTLGNVCKLVNGRAFKPHEWEQSGTPIIRIQNLNDSTKPFNYTTKTFPENFRVKRGDILLSWSGTPGTSFGCFRWNGPDGWLNQHIFNVRLYEEVSPNFFIYQVNSKLNELIARAHGGVGLQHITRGALSSVNITVPPLAEQERIVKILDEADELRKLRAQADRRTADLIPALFHEMFGDPATNPKGWKKAILGDVIYGAKDGPHVSPKYSEIGVPFLSTRHVKPGRVIWEDLKFISSGDAEYHWKKCKPEKGDILYTKGGTTGIAATINFETPIAIWVHIALLKTNHSKVDSIWLENMLNDSFCYQQSQKFTHGITNKDLGLTRMVNIKMYLPPLPLQHEFAQRVTEIRRMEADQAKSKSRLDALFQSLLHRAFEGEF